MFNGQVIRIFTVKQFHNIGTIHILLLIKITNVCQITKKESKRPSYFYR